jgi:hypothetical protein
MDVLPCGHAANEGTSRLCPHLVGAEVDIWHFRLLRGSGVASDLVCGECESDLSQGRPPDLTVVCEGCVERVTTERWHMQGWRGSPGIDERPEPVGLHYGEALAGPDIASPRATAPFERGWITVSADGGVWSHADGRDRRAAEVDIHALQEQPADRGKQPIIAAHASDDGRFVAVVNDYGRTGIVLDLATGPTVLRLDRGSHHPEQTRFPVAFVTLRDGDTVVIAATDWNRVDAFDPASGQLLTPRRPTSYRTGEQRPAHHLDYFHGALHPSPDGRWVLDDGWVWQPLGVPSAWSVERWLGGNVWETEDGPSLAMFGERAYLWDAPMCWVDERRVAIWGRGYDDEAMLDGIAVYDVEDVVLVAEFAGQPRGDLWSDGRRLLATGDGELSVWDPFTGERTARLPETAPIAFNRWLGELLVEDDGRLRRVRLG